MVHCHFGIHGDNIVECERMLSLLCQALEGDGASLSGNIPAPEIIFTAVDETFHVTLYPAFGRWQQDFQGYLYKRGGVLRESADAILTKINDDTETPILAIEFCSALPAGNQAWQRSGRAYSMAKAGIPYLFITELGGFELSVGRKKKAARLPNPAVPYSYYAYSYYSGNPIAVVYGLNPGADEIHKFRYREAICTHTHIALIKAIVQGENIDEYLNEIHKKGMQFIVTASEASRGNNLNAFQWKKINQSLQEGCNSHMIIDESGFHWKKTITIPIKDTVKRILKEVEEIAVSVASYNLPFCVIKRDNFRRFHDILIEAYGQFPSLIQHNLEVGDSLAVCWINGFKPHGEDARPDRGLLPFLRMLLGDDIRVLTLVYGPAPVAMIEDLAHHPKRLADSNGLWEAILKLSDAVICDSGQAHTHVVFQQGMMDSVRHAHSIQVSMPVTPPFPLLKHIGEDDVDTAVNILFGHLLADSCFVSMCNPPGGDWSGVSLLCGLEEYRWLSLPRVSQSGSKRPDHIVQLADDYLLIIESKDTFAHLERGIGPRLIQYCAELFSSEPSCKRLHGCDKWTDMTEGFVLPELHYISGCAFIKKNETDLSQVLHQSQTDVAFLFSFDKNETLMEIIMSEKIICVMRTLLNCIHIPEGLKLRIVIRKI